MGYIGSKDKTLGSVNTSHIADDAVTSAKIKDDITNDLTELGRHMNVAGENIANKLDLFINNMTFGLEKLFGASKEEKES